MSIRQHWRDAADVIPGSNYTRCSFESYRQEPPFIGPVGARLTEFKGLWSGRRVRHHKADGSNAAIRIRKNHVARNGPRHIVVGAVACSVLVELWRPPIVALDFVVPGLLVVDPPERHATRLHASSRRRDGARQAPRRSKKDE